MNREELLELAPLDAFGLLDEVEAALFHRAFHQATPAVQAEVLALQAELAEAEHFLAEEDPRPILRRKVLLRLEEVIDETAEGLRPIAQIGSRGREAAPVARSPEPEMTESRRDPASLAAFRSLMEEFAERNARVAARTTPFWRAASIMLLAALAASLYFQVQTRREAKEFADTVMTLGIDRQIGLRVPDLHEFSKVSGRSLAMQPVDPSHFLGRSSAVLLVDTEHRRVVLATFGLARIQPGLYRCRAVDREGRVEDFAGIEADRFLACGIGSLPPGFEAVAYELINAKGDVIFSVKV